MQDDVKASFGLQPDMGRAYRRLAVAHLEAAGFEQPLEILKDLYRQCTPGAAEFAEEAASFKKEYAEAMRKAAYVNRRRRCSRVWQTVSFRCPRRGQAAAWRPAIHGTHRGNPAIQAAFGAKLFRQVRRPPGRDSQTRVSKSVRNGKGAIGCATGWSATGHLARRPNSQWPSRRAAASPRQSGRSRTTDALEKLSQTG